MCLVVYEYIHICMFVRRPAIDDGCVYIIFICLCSYTCIYIYKWLFVSAAQRTANSAQHQIPICFPCTYVYVYYNVCNVDEHGFSSRIDLLLMLP